MSTTTEHVAIEALREIAKDVHVTPSVELARKALEQIEAMQKPTVHNLSAEPLIVKPPGGGF